MQTNATFSVVISTKNRWRAPKLATDRSLKCPCCRLVIMTMRVFIRNIAVGDSTVLCSIARCIIFGVPRLPVRPCDERPPAMYGHFCLVPRVSVHDRYYCSYFEMFAPNPPVGWGGGGGLTKNNDFLEFMKCLTFEIVTL